MRLRTMRGLWDSCPASIPKLWWWLCGKAASTVNLRQRLARDVLKAYVDKKARLGQSLVAARTPPDAATRGHGDAASEQTDAGTRRHGDAAKGALVPPDKVSSTGNPGQPNGLQTGTTADIAVSPRRRVAASGGSENQ